MTTKNKFLLEEYTARVNRAIDYIENNLKSGLNLEQIASASGFSPFHFHRIFSSLTGETLNAFVKRLRVEKAASMLIHNPKYSVTQIAMKCGFSTSQSLARSFRESFSISPSDWRNGGYKDSKIRNMNNKNRNDTTLSSSYTVDKGRINNNQQKRSIIIMKVEVKDLPQMAVAYVRHIGPYQGNPKLFEKLFGKLCGWAGPRNLIGKQPQFISVYRDDPKVTEESKLRVDVCLVVPDDTEVDGEVQKQTLDGGKYAVANFELEDASGYSKAWTSVYRDWLPKSGYQPDDRPAFEMSLNDPKQHPKGHHIVDICVPVKPL